MHPNTNLEYEWHPDATISNNRWEVPNPSYVNTGYPTTGPANQAGFGGHNIQAVPDFHYLQRHYSPIPNAFEAHSHYSGNPIPSDRLPVWTDTHQALPYPNHPLSIISPSPLRPTEFARFGSNDLSIADSPLWMVETYGSTSTQPVHSPSTGAPSSSYYPNNASLSQGDTQIIFGRPVPQRRRFSICYRPTSAQYTVNLPNRLSRRPWEFPSCHLSSAAASGQATEHQSDAVAPPGDTPLTADHPNWRLTQEMYDSIVATLDPKKRPNKKMPAPSGQCKLCDSVCKRSGTLQQHIVILHRQKLARRVIAGQQYNVELALAFVVAQVRSDQRGTLRDPESVRFTNLLARYPEGLPVLVPTEFPQLREKLTKFCGEERWTGVKCGCCGMMMSRRIGRKSQMACDKLCTH